jgi:hypothetical protein
MGLIRPGAQVGGKELRLKLDDLFVLIASYICNPFSWVPVYMYLGYGRDVWG